MIDPTVAPDAGNLMSVLTSAATIVYIQKWLKTTYPYASFVKAFPGADRWAHRFAGGLGALIATMGIHVASTWTWASGGDVTAHVPAGAAILLSLWAWFKVFIFQHFFYDVSRQAPYTPPPPNGAKV